MTEHKDEKLRELIKQNIHPAQSELQHDLWPQMQRTLQERSVTVPWFDWALMAAMATLLCFVPGVIPVLLYHL